MIKYMHTRYRMGIKGSHKGMELPCRLPCSLFCAHKKIYEGSASSLHGW
jgi:hypothetical protein